MTTLQQIELQCPVCENRFRSQAVVSTNSFGGKRTDFHERAAGTQPLPYLVHTCNRCGYTGAEPVLDPAPVEEPAGGEVAAPALPTQDAYTDENTVVVVPEQYRTRDYTYVLTGPDGSTVPVSLDALGNVVLTPALVKNLAGGDYVLSAVQGIDGSVADITTVNLLVPSA